jgi:hypothetical protein
LSAVAQTALVSPSQFLVAAHAGLTINPGAVTTSMIHDMIRA